MPPLFAAQDWHVGLATALAGAVGYLFSELRKAMKERSQSQLAKEAQDEQLALARKKQDNDELRAIIARQDQTIRKIEIAEEQCRQREMRLQRAVVYLHGVACGLVAERRAAGAKLEEMRPLSDFIPDERELDERRRNTAQAAILVKAEAEKVTNATTEPPGGGSAG